jgi:hypothetical protein
MYTPNCLIGDADDLRYRQILEHEERRAVILAKIGPSAIGPPPEEEGLAASSELTAKININDDPPADLNSEESRRKQGPATTSSDQPRSRKYQDPRSKLLPYSESAEKGLLCSMWLDPRVKKECLQRCSAPMFHLPAHVALFNSFAEIESATGKMEFPLVLEHLSRNDRLDEFGLDQDEQKATLNEIFCYVPCSDNWGHYFEWLLAEYQRREIRKFCWDLEQKTADSQIDVKQLLPELDAFHTKLANEVTSPQQPLDLYRSVMRNLDDFASLTIPPRAPLLGDWMKEGDIGFVHGWRGDGKTWFVDLLMAALALGEPLGTWQVPSTVSVLYLDGEMAYDDAKGRLLGLIGSGNTNFRIIHHEDLFQYDCCTMNLANPVTQEVLTELCLESAIRVLVLDNLSCLAEGVLENDAIEWEKLQPWFLTLRRHRISVILLLHDGLSGRPRGNTKREDPINWSIKIKRIDLEPGELGAKFETSFDKHRNTQKPEPTRRWHVVTQAEGRVTYGCEELSLEAKVLEQIQAGKTSASVIAKTLGVHSSTVSRAADKLEVKGKIETRAKGYFPLQ